MNESLVLENIKLEPKEFLTFQKIAVARTSILQIVVTIICLLLIPILNNLFSIAMTLLGLKVDSLIILSIVAAILIWLNIQCINYIITRRVKKSNGSILRNYTYIFDQQGIHIKSDFGHSFTDWRGLVKIRLIKNNIYLFNDVTSAYIIPGRYIGSEAEVKKAFEDIIIFYNKRNTQF